MLINANTFVQKMPHYTSLVICFNNSITFFTVTRSEKKKAETKPENKKDGACPDDLRM